MTDRASVLRPYGVPAGATAQRPSWLALPVSLRAAIEERLGSAVTKADSQGGGFTSGFASRLLLADGSRVFVKAVSSVTSPEVFASYQQEVVVAGALPDRVPAPKLRWAAEHEEWQVLAFDDVAARTPQRPWQQNELGIVLDMLTPLAAALTPAPSGLLRSTPQLSLTGSSPSGDDLTQQTPPPMHGSSSPCGSGTSRTWRTSRATGPPLQQVTPQSTSTCVTTICC
jgi:hypothetical protein